MEIFAVCNCVVTKSNFTNSYNRQLRHAGAQRRLSLDYSGSGKRSRGRERVRKGTGRVSNGDEIEELRPASGLLGFGHPSRPPKKGDKELTIT